MRQYPKPVENYTNTCLVMAWVNLLWIMIFMWAWQGYIVSLLVGAVVFRWIKWLDLKRARVTT